MASKDILVIGNGFDLFHGKKTGYMDFIRCVEAAFGKQTQQRDALETKLTELCNVNGFFRHFHFLMAEEETWTFFEQEMKRILEALCGFEDKMLEEEKDPEFDLISYNLVAGNFTYRDLQIFKHFARIFEQVIDDPTGGMYKLRQLFITPEHTLCSRAMIDEVKRELDDFTEALDVYLTGYVAGQEPEGKIEGLKENPPDYVINFNFTDTIQAYDIPEERIFYAKGRAGSDPVSLVLGCPGEEEDHVEWISLRNYYQSLVKGIGRPDPAQLYPGKEGDGTDSVALRFFGYSFPEGDALLIDELWRAAGQKRVLCKDREDYARKVLALIRLFGRERVTQEIDQKDLVFEIASEGQI